MFRILDLPRLLPRQRAASGTTEATPAVAVVPDLGPLTNDIRLAQYKRKKAILALNPRATFSLEVYA